MEHVNGVFFFSSFISHVVRCPNDSSYFAYSITRAIHLVETHVRCELVCGTWYEVGARAKERERESERDSPAELTNKTLYVAATVSSAISDVDARMKYSNEFTSAPPPLVVP